MASRVLFSLFLGTLGACQWFGREEGKLLVWPGTGQTWAARDEGGGDDDDDDDDDDGYVYDDDGYGHDDDEYDDDDDVYTTAEKKQIDQGLANLSHAILAPPLSHSLPASAPEFGLDAVAV